MSCCSMMHGHSVVFLYWLLCDMFFACVCCARQFHFHWFESFCVHGMFSGVTKTPRLVLLSRLSRRAPTEEETVEQLHSLSREAKALRRCSM